MTRPACLHAATFGITDEYAGEGPRTYVALKPEVADAVMKDSRLVAQVKAKLYEVSRLWTKLLLIASGCA